MKNMVHNNTYHKLIYIPYALVVRLCAKSMIKQKIDVSLKVLIKVRVIFLINIRQILENGRLPFFLLFLPAI